MSIAKVTSPQETAIFICALQGISALEPPLHSPIFLFLDCHKLFPSRDRLVAHRKRDHQFGQRRRRYHHLERLT
ncbi:hypothetical protein BT96DRAFT_29614 [Gymnopus androsaceus JB14]|uniref:Uncharacterized protein n=1 Tax=Gymnopus androsaceus JB14 TaxID=1447944 RepID=A0A6A4IGT4_9AGAR|nr:hypothetical protein BT96DRAFT_29614 [Gymnopus androsaceus JB14]